MDLNMEIIEQLRSCIEVGSDSMLRKILSSFTKSQVAALVNEKIPKYGMSLFHISVGFSENAISVIKILKEYGADPNNLCCDDIVSPLHLSILYEFDIVLDYLLTNGGDPFIQDGDGKSCYDLVRDIQEPNILRTVLFRHSTSADLTPIRNDSMVFSEQNDVSVDLVASTPSSPTHTEVKILQLKMNHFSVSLPQTSNPTKNKLFNFASNEVMLSESEKNYSSELKSVINDLSLIDKLKFADLQVEFAQDCTQDSSKKKGKCYYNYVLLDPKIIKRINFSGDYFKSDVIKNSEKFRKFISAIFHVGVGCANHPNQILVDAKIALGMKNINSSNLSEKIFKILEIWKSGQEVIFHSFFPHSSEREAWAYEASIIDAMGLKELPKLKNNFESGIFATEWSQKQRNQFGVFSLKTSFSRFATNYRNCKKVSQQEVIIP